MKFSDISKSDIQYLLCAMLACLGLMVIVLEYSDSNRLVVLIVLVCSSFLMMILVRLDEVVSLLEGTENDTC